MKELKNRVLKQALVDWRSLEWIQGNLKQLRPDRLEKLIHSIEENDIIKAFHVWEHDGKLACLDGNHLKVALEQVAKRGKIKIPSQLKADFIECEDLKAAHRLVLVYSAQYAEITHDGLAEFLATAELTQELPAFEQSINLPEIDLQAFQTELAQANHPAAEDGFEPPAIETIKTNIQRGDIFQVGRHRVMCGDSTSEANAKLLMDGKKALLYLTDPPYAVGYADKNKFLNEFDKGKRIQTEIENDHLSLEDACKIWKAAHINALSSCSDQASYYQFACQGGDQMMMMMMMMLNESDWQVRHELIWLKNNHVLGRTDYAYKHEPILFGWKKEGTHKFYGGFQTSIFEYDKPLKSDLHPTMKPIPLIAKLISNSSQTNEIVLDLFLGSGTTLIACEQLNRICHGMEISPQYCQVILNRAKKFNPEIEIKCLNREFDLLIN
jgi:DNA modification methylase